MDILTCIDRRVSSTIQQSESAMPRGKKRKGISKVQLVEKAIAELGKDAMPLDIQRIVKEKHGVELPTSLISNYKAYIAKRKKRVGRGLGLRRAAASAKAGGISMADILAVKALANRIGANQVAELAKVLAK